MAEDLEDNPQSDSFAATPAKPQRLSDRVARLTDDAPRNEGPDPGEPDPVAEPIIADTFHIGRVMRPAGRMVLGSRALAPIPAAAGSESAGRGQSPVFSSAEEGRRRGFSGGAAILLVCALAAGATALLTTMVHKGAGSSGVKAVTTQAAQAGGNAPAVQADSAQGSARPIAQLAAVASIDQLNALSNGSREVVEVAGPGADGLVVENISGDPSSPIPVRIKVRQVDAADYSFLMFRGLPENFSFSAGFRLKDSWAVSLKDVADLKLVPPGDYRGRFKLEVLLVKGRNQPVESHTMLVSLSGAKVVAPAETGSVASARSGPAPGERLLTAAPPASEPIREAPEGEQALPAGLSGPPEVTITPQEEAEMMERAMKILADGDIASARLFLEHIARRGSGKGALALAQTYDPQFFRSMATLGGIRPDPERAKKWYRIAAELGQDGARERLSALAGQ
ncbi:MAG: SEL1-like repeat protein [Rhodomicrobiaceae bacterium]